MNNIMTKLSFIKNIAKRAIYGNEEGKTLFEKLKETKIEECDKDLPLGIKIGSLLNFDCGADSVIAENDFLFSINEDENFIVFSIGKIKVTSAIMLYRFYIKGMESESIYLLEIGTKDGELLSSALYSNYDSLGIVRESENAVTSNNEAALNYWLEGDTPILGGPVFSIFNDKNGEEIEIPYQRVNAPDLMKQLVSSEVEFIYDKQRDDNVEEITHTVANYGRMLDNLAFGGKELCMVRLSESEQSASMEIYVGVELKNSQIKKY